MDGLGEVRGRYVEMGKGGGLLKEREGDLSTSLCQREKCSLPDAVYYALEGLK